MTGEETEEEVALQLRFPCGRRDADLHGRLQALLGDLQDLRHLGPTRDLYHKTVPAGLEIEGPERTVLLHITDVGPMQSVAVGAK